MRCRGRLPRRPAAKLCAYIKLNGIGQPNYTLPPLISEKTISLYSGRLGSRPLHFIGIHISKITHICGGLRGRCPLRPLYMQLHYLIILIKAKPLSKFCWGLGLRPNRFPRRGKPTALGAKGGCDPTSLKLDGSHYSDLAIVCNVNSIPKLLPTERNWVGECFYKRQKSIPKHILQYQLVYPLLCQAVIQVFTHKLRLKELVIILQINLLHYILVPHILALQIVGG